MTRDLLNLSTSDFGGWSNDHTKPDYAHPAYREMMLRWQIVHDIRSGTANIRTRAEYYLPRYEAEELPDWISRVNMTYVNDWYASTLEEHVGLGLGEPIQFDKEVPEVLIPMLEDVDGEGNQIDVAAEQWLDAAMHFGHGVLFTDYPVTTNVANKEQERALNIRPYVTWYPAPHILNWRTVKFGGVTVITHIAFRNFDTTADGHVCEYYRHFTQEVVTDPATDRVTSLGAITWQAWEKIKGNSGPSGLGGNDNGTATKDDFVDRGSGTLTGPSRIPVRVVYGGKKLGTLHSRPSLEGLAFSNLEETQVGSDYGSIMHKCNVPTACFIGRQAPSPGQAKVQMGQGMDLLPGGTAFYLEPTGHAIADTRQRLEDIRTNMRRQGATSIDPSIGGRPMTATEAALWSKQRNAKLKKSVQSLQDGIEGMLADFAVYLNVDSIEGSVISGGSVVLSTNFSGASVDPQYLNVLLQAYLNNALPLEALLYALKNGELPDDFSAEDEAFRLLAAQAAQTDVEPDPTDPTEDAEGEPTDSSAKRRAKVRQTNSDRAKAAASDSSGGAAGSDSTSYGA
jgi:hypothetical protein